MVLIKGAMAIAAAALVWWRLGRPIAPALAARYVTALCVSAGAVAWLWGLHLIPLGAGAFYLSLLGIYRVGRRDPLLSAPASGSGKEAGRARLPIHPSETGLNAPVLVTPPRPAEHLPARPGEPPVPGLG